MNQKAKRLTDWLTYLNRMMMHDVKLSLRVMELWTSWWPISNDTVLTLEMKFTLSLLFTLLFYFYLRTRDSISCRVGLYVVRSVSRSHFLKFLVVFTLLFPDLNRPWLRIVLYRTVSRRKVIWYADDPLWSLLLTSINEWLSSNIARM